MYLFNKDNKLLFLTVGIVLMLMSCTSRYEKKFVEGCASSGGIPKGCSCVYEYLKDEYGEDRLAYLDEHPEKISQRFMDQFMESGIRAASQCRKQGNI